MNPHPVLIPIAYTLQDRPDCEIRKTPEGWTVAGFLEPHCCPCAAANAYLKHKGACTCPTSK